MLVHSNLCGRLGQGKVSIYSQAHAKPCQSASRLGVCVVEVEAETEVFLYVALKTQLCTRASSNIHCSTFKTITATARARAMTDHQGGPSEKPLREALEPVSEPYLPSLHGTYSIAKEVLMGPFQSEYRRSESVRILSDRKCIICCVLRRS